MPDDLRPEAEPGRRCRCWGWGAAADADGASLAPAALFPLCGRVLAGQGLGGWDAVLEKMGNGVGSTLNPRASAVRGRSASLGGVRDRSERARVREWLCAYACAYARVCMHVCACACVFLHVSTRVCTYVSVCAHVHVRVCTHMHVCALVLGTPSTRGALRVR